MVKFVCEFPTFYPQIISLSFYPQMIANLSLRFFCEIQRRRGALCAFRLRLVYNTIFFIFSQKEQEFEQYANAGYQGHCRQQFRSSHRNMISTSTRSDFCINKRCLFVCVCYNVCCQSTRLCQFRFHESQLQRSTDQILALMEQFLGFHQLILGASLHNNKTLFALWSGGKCSYKKPSNEKKFLTLRLTYSDYPGIQINI